MKKLTAEFAITLIILLGAGASAGAQERVSKCFRADWLQGERVVNFTISGGKVAGTFVVEGGGDGGSPPDATYEFKGTLKGNALTVAFAGNRLPDVSPSEMKSLTWTLAQSGDKEILRIKFRGKNYDTNKFVDSLAAFEPCGESYAVLAKGAKRVQFARGANSATFPLAALAASRGTRGTATFLINAAKSQVLEIQAHGCSVEVYLPGGKIYEYVEPGSENESGSERGYASTQMDMMTIDALPVSGNYLIVLRKLTEDSAPGTLTVTVTNKK